MKIDIFSTLAILAAIVALFSCNKEDNSITTDNNRIEMNKGTETAIQNFINQVQRRVETRWTPDIPVYPETPEPIQMRMYVQNAVDCCDRFGSCLPEVIVIPPPSIVYPGEPVDWNVTKQGSQLKQMVDDNQVTLRRDYNQSTNIEYYIYNGVEDKNLELVVPVTYQ